MMDCRRVKQLLPLWIGQDLPDAVMADSVAKHIQQCRECEQRRVELQGSLDVLQGSSAETLTAGSIGRSLWPDLVSRISDWENHRRRERFNGWIPASVMALAAALMIAVSLPSVRDAFFDDSADSMKTVDLFGTHSEFNLDKVSDSNQPSKTATSPGRPPLGIPVNYKPDQW